MQKQLYSIFVITTMAVLLSGCILNVESNRRSRGDMWHDSDLATLRRGQTTSEQVLNAFGEPGRRISPEQDSEIWRYTYSNVEQTEVGFIFLFHIDVEDETTRELNIQIENGVVQDFWTRKY